MEIKEKEVLAEEHFNRGFKAHLDGELIEAIHEYKTSIGLSPSAVAYTFLAWAYSLLGMYENAIEECLNAIDVDPDYGNPYNDIGSYMISLGRYDEAKIFLEKALRAPDYEPRHYPLYNLGRIYEKKGDWLKALEYYNCSLEIEPDYELAQDAVLRLTTLLN